MSAFVIFLYSNSVSEKEGIFNIIYVPFHMGNQNIKIDLMLHKSAGKCAQERVWSAK